MSNTEPVRGAVAQLCTIAISSIVPIDGWNPRISFDDAPLKSLAASMRDRGCLVPVLVDATGAGQYRLVDGERRYKAAVLAELTELPAIARPADAGRDDAAREGELLVDAVVANQLRAQLSPVEEALACRRLKSEHGLTVKGIAQKLQMTQVRVRERLAVLELPEALWPRIAGGEIPAGAIAALVGLEKIHPGLAAVAVTLVLDRSDVYDADPWRWRDVASDPVAVVAGGLHDETVAAPAGVFIATRGYPLSQFALDERAQAAAAQLAQLRGTPVDALELRFDRDAIERARALHAAHTPEHGWVTLIVGQDVADAIAGEQVLAALKASKAETKREHAVKDEPVASAGGGETGGAPADETVAKERARAERAEQAAERERCAAFNEELGAAIVNSLSRVKVDDRVVKVLTAINVAGELDRIAMRGARYGFPGWVTIEEGTRGPKRRYIDKRTDAQAKAVEYLAGAKSAGEVAGRTLALLLMAVYAQEGAVANSSQAFHTVRVQSAMPWAGDVPELVDAIAAEKLPAALMAPVLEERRALQAQRRAAAAAKADALARVAELEQRIDELTGEELDELERLSRVAHGEYSAQAWKLRDAIRARRTALDGAGDDEATAEQEPEAPSRAGAE
ncbi:MAG: ParB/RepB/Spo0J family partition protein [Thermoleophilia bacterium]